MIDLQVNHKPGVSISNRKANILRLFQDNQRLAKSIEHLQVRLPNTDSQFKSHLCYTLHCIITEIFFFLSNSSVFKKETDFKTSIATFKMINNDLKNK